MAKNPWRDDMTPEEFREYNERRLEAINRECDWEDCDEEIQWPREYCHRHDQLALERAAREVFGDRSRTTDAHLVDRIRRYRQRIKRTADVEFAAEATGEPEQLTIWSGEGGEIMVNREDDS